MSGLSKRKLWRIFVIYPKFQFKLLAYLLGVLLTGFGVISYAIIASFDHLKAIGVKANLPADHIFFRFLDHQITNLFFPTLTVTYIIILVIATLLTLRLSQKLAGPVVRLNSFFSGIKNNPSSRKELKFREGDFFSELPAEINAAFDAVEKK